MELSIKEVGYFSYNQIAQNRLNASLPNEKHFFAHQNNRFPLKLKKVTNDFTIVLNFENNKDYFREIWCLSLQSNYGQGSLLEIESDGLRAMDDFIGILNRYGFTYTGKLSFYNPSIEIKTMAADFLRTYMSSYMKNKVMIFHCKDWQYIYIQYYYQSGGVKVYFLEDGYWFIPCIPEKNSPLYELCKTVSYLLNHYELVSIFGHKKNNFV